MENMDFTVKMISQDGLDTISYDSNFYIEDGILYYGPEEIARDIEDDLLYVAEKIVEFCYDTVLEITDEDGEIIYKNDEYDDDDDIVATFGADDDKPNYIRDIDFEESFKKYNETLKKALGE